MSRKSILAGLVLGIAALAGSQPAQSAVVSGDTVAMYGGGGLGAFAPTTIPPSALPNSGTGFTSRTQTFGGGQSGGEFLANKVGGGTGYDDRFFTFCLERTENIALNGTQYQVIKSTQAVGGGGGPNPDPVSLQTALLYALYSLKGGPVDLTSLVPTFVYDNASWANALQEAIWSLEQESGFVLSANGTTLVNAATAQVNSLIGAGIIQATDDSSVFGVYALNLYNSVAQNPDGTFTGTGRHQDILYFMDMGGGITLVPEPSTFAVWGGLGALGMLAGYRRRSRS